MKLHTDPTSSQNTITSYGDGYIEVNQVRYSRAVAFGPKGEISDWPVKSAAGISPALLRQAAGLAAMPRDPMAFLDETDSRPVVAVPGAPEVVLVGTGSRQIFPPLEVLDALLSLGVGVEVMDTLAAARTYNILMAEGRHVIAALIPTDGATPA